MENKVNKELFSGLYTYIDKVETDLEKKRLKAKKHEGLMRRFSEILQR